MTPLEQVAIYAETLGCEVVTLRQAVPSTGQPAMLTFNDPPEFKRQADALRKRLTDDRKSLICVN